MNEKNKQVELQSSCIKRFAPVYARIKELVETKEKTILVAIDGKCASGKTTLGYYLKREFDANLFHMDDFFLQKEQRTEERMKEIGGNVDYERFHQEVIQPLLGGKKILYRPFQCKTLQIQEGIEILPKRVNVIEGSYSQHDYFGDIYDVRVFMNINTDKQIDNIRKRNGEEQLKVFLERWIPKEEAYFEKFLIQQKSEFIVEWK